MSTNTRTLTSDPWGSDAPPREAEAGWNDPDTEDHADTARDTAGVSLADVPDEWPDEPEAVDLWP